MSNRREVTIILKIGCCHGFRIFRYIASCKSDIHLKWSENLFIFKVITEAMVFDTCESDTKC